MDHCTLVVLSETYVRLLKCCPKKIKRCAFFQCTEFTKSHHRSASKSQPLKEAFLWHAMVNGSSHLYHSKKKRWIYHIYISYLSYILYKIPRPGGKGKQTHLKDLRTHHGPFDVKTFRCQIRPFQGTRVGTVCHRRTDGGFVWDAIFDLVACSFKSFWIRCSGCYDKTIIFEGIAAHLIKNQVWDRKTVLLLTVLNKDRSLLWPRVLGSWVLVYIFAKTIFEKAAWQWSLSVKGLLYSVMAPLWQLKTHTVAIKDWAGLHFEVSFCQF